MTIKKELTELYNWGNRFRCQIIDTVTLIDVLLSEILTELISTHETRESIQNHLFADKTPLEQKINLFNSLNKNKLFEPIKNDKEINKQLEYARVLRNYMAHSRIATDDNAIKEFKNEKILFKSRTTKGLKTLTFKFRGEEDVKKLIYCQEVFAPTLESIYRKLAIVLQYLQSR